MTGQSPGPVLVGVDLCYPLLDISRGQAADHYLGHRVHSQQASAAALPSTDDCFDTVFSQDTLHMVDDPIRMLTACARVLEPGGLAMIRVIRRPWALALIEGVFRTGFLKPEVKRCQGIPRSRNSRLAQAYST